MSSMNLVTELEYLIIGAGPAGLQLGYYFEKSHRNYMILEAGDNPGTFFKNFPRHKKLISINKIYTGCDDPEVNLRWDWNSLLSDSEDMRFKNYSKEYFPHTDALVDYLGDFATHFKLNIKYGCKVVKISKDDKFFVVDNNDNVYCAERLIIATGVSKPYIPSIPGIELAENYVDVSINPEDFINQRVLIIGKGNSGFETADNLIGTTALIHIASPNSVKMAWKTKYVGNLRAANNNLLDTYQLKSQNLLLDATINKIEHQNGKFVVSFSYTNVNEDEDIVYDRVIVCTGFQFDDSIFDESCKPQLVINNRFPAQTSAWESTNIQKLYFAGVLMHMRDYKKKQSGFIHGFRYNIRSLHQILECRYHNKELPYQVIQANPESITQAIINRVNLSSGLWQQTGFLCDVVVISKEGKTAQYYEDIPIDYVHESNLGQEEHYYTITLEFGLDLINASPDPFALKRVHKDDIENAEQSPSLHPIIRHFCGSNLICEHHVIEDIASEWLENVHIKPLLKFMYSQLLRYICLAEVA